MERKRYAVDGSLYDRLNQRNYWFDESYGATPNNNYTPQPTIQPTNDIANTDTNTTGSVRQRTQQRTTSNNSSSDIVTIGTRSFGDAFKQARNAGLDKFRWKGRVYGTKYANEVGNSNTSNKRTTIKPTAKSTIKSTKQTRTTNTNNNTNASRTTYTRDNNGYAQLPEVTVTAPAKKKTSANMFQRSLQTVHKAVNRMEGSARVPISVPSDLRKTKYSEDFKRDLIMHRRYGIPNTSMYYKGKWYK